MRRVHSHDKQIASLGGLTCRLEKAKRGVTAGVIIYQESFHFGKPPLQIDNLRYSFASSKSFSEPLRLNSIFRHSHNLQLTPPTMASTRPKTLTVSLPGARKDD